MIPPYIDNHVGSRRHVAVDASRSCAVDLVMMVLLAAELGQRMTLSTHRIQAYLQQLGGVWIVAIRTVHSLAIHPALDERAPFIVFFKDLAIGIVDAVFQKARHIATEKRLPWLSIAGDRMPPGMAGSTGFDLCMGTRLALPMHRACIRLGARPRATRWG